MSTSPTGPSGSPRPCTDCGKPIPEPDLEAEAGRIDRELGLEFGRLVDRRAWAAGPPDGLLENLVGWSSGAKARRAIWQRGRQLWAERLAPERWSRCGDCAPPAPPQAPA